MDYGAIFKRSANIVWQSKFLIVLGFLAALGSGAFPSGGGGGPSGTAGNGNGQPFGDPGQFPDFGGEFAALAVGTILALLCLVLLIGIALWVVSTVARGGLIAAVDAIETGEKSSLGRAWGAAWQKVWRLLGIGLLPGIPGLLLFIIAVVGLGAYGGAVALFGEEIVEPLGRTGLPVALALFACIIVPIILALAIVRNFAERACMLEDLGVIDSYRRGWNVLVGNLGEAIVLFVLQIAIFVVLGIVFFIPGLIVALCCLLWPLLIVVQGAITAFVSAVWTLAWRQWTGKARLVEKAPLTV